MSDDGLISYPFPLRQGKPIVRLILPANLNMEEVRRITRMLETLAIDRFDQNEWFRKMAEAQQNIYRPPLGSGLLIGSALGNAMGHLTNTPQPPPSPETWTDKIRKWWNERFSTA